MRRLTQHPQLRLITEISIAPLITVVLVLLFVFMLVGPLLHEGGAARTSVASNKKVDSAPKIIAHLVLGENKTISLEGREVAVVDLKDRLARLVKENPGVGVIVQMNRDLPVQVLVDLMDVLRQAGVEKTSVATVEK